MKLLLFIGLNLVFAGAFAQVPNHKNSTLVPSPGYPRNFKGNDSEQLRKQFQEYFERTKAENQLLADKQGNIVRLPQDRMPCMVPDSATVALMPNAWSAVTVPFQPQYHPIPNPALPLSSWNNTRDNPAPSK